MSQPATYKCWLSSSQQANITIYNDLYDMSDSNMSNTFCEKAEWP